MHLMPSRKANYQLQDRFYRGFSSTFAGNCFACLPANLRASCLLVGPVEITCEDCPLDTFNNKENSLSCQRCPHGLIASTGASQCLPRPKCPPGTEPVFRNNKCTRCTSFRFNDGTKSECEACPPGMMGNKREGSTKCVPCPPGTFKNDLHDEQCRSCRTRQNSFVTGAQYCVNDNVPCPPIFFQH